VCLQLIVLKNKVHSLLFWDVVQCRLAVFCEIPVCAAQHLKRMNISTASRQNIKILPEQNLVVYEANCAFLIIATVLQNICHNYKLMHDSPNNNMQVRTKSWKFSDEIFSASVSNTLLNSTRVTLDDK